MSIDQARALVPRPLKRLQRLRHPACTAVDAGNFAIDLEQLDAVTDDGRVRPDKDLACGAGTPERFERLRVSPETDQPNGSQEFDPGRRRREENGRWVGTRRRL